MGREIDPRMDRLVRLISIYCDRSPGEFIVLLNEFSFTVWIDENIYTTWGSTVKFGDPLIATISRGSDRPDDLAAIYHQQTVEVYNPNALWGELLPLLEGELLLDTLAEV